MADDFKVVFELDVARATSAAQRLSDQLATITTELGKMGSAGNVAQDLGLSFGKTTPAIRASSQQAQQASRSYRNVSTAMDDMILAQRQVGQSFSNSLKSRLQDEALTARMAETTLPRLRYALYDVSRTLRTVGLAFGAVSVAAVGAAISWERSLANVVRTTGAYGNQIEMLRSGLGQLTREIPQSFGDLSEIAALGGQLGIETEGIVDFTRVVAMLTTTTDLSAEAAGTALGRFRALLDVAPSEFEALASAILRTGINSVATETQIVNIATQISSMADFAGLTAHEVVGLSAALASVGAQPELSRGTITRVFTQMSRAIAQGGERLEEFARLSGTTGDQFAKAFGTDDFGGLFQTFLANISKEGANAVQVLNDLGIASVRDVPLLLRLSGATDTVTKAFQDAAIGWERATELQDNYGIVVETTAEQLRLLWNAVTELFATMGAGTTGPLADFVRFLREAINGLTDFLATPFGQGLALMVIGLTAVIAALALFGAGLTNVMAGIAGVRTVIFAFRDAAGAAATRAGILSGALNTMGLSSGRAATAMRILGGAIRAFLPIAIAMAALTLPDTLRDLNKWANDSAAAANGVNSLTNALNDLEKVGNPLQRLEAGVGGSGAATVRAYIQNIDEGLNKLASSGKMEEFNEQLDRFAKAMGVRPSDALAQFLPQTTEALEAMGDSATKAATDMEALNRAQEEAAQVAADLAFSLGLSEEGFEDWEKAVSAAQSGAVNLGKAITAATTKGIFSLEKFNKSMEAQVVAFENWEKNLLTLASKGVGTDVIMQLLSEGPEAGAQLAQSLVDNFGTKLGDKAVDLIRRGAEMGDAIAGGFTNNTALLTQAALKGDEAGAAMLEAILEGASPEKIAAIVSEYDIPVPVYADLDTKPSERAMEKFLNTPWATEIRANIRFSQSQAQLWQQYGIRAFADGGPVRGPGTGTSDSVPAMLSNGEYVIRASAVRQYGYGFLDAVNRGVAKFAQGGPVGGGSGTSAIGTGIMELGPKSLGRMGGGSPTVNVYLDDVAIAKAAQRGQRQLTYTGAQ